MSDAAYDDRVRVIQRIIHEPGTVEQVATGLRELADLDSGDCVHDSPDGSQRCVTCQARMFLQALEEYQRS